MTKGYDDWRYQLIVINTSGTQAAFLEARHRAHAGADDRIRCGEATGLDHLPSTLPDDQRGVVCRRDHSRGPAVLDELQA
jgi:hypothetical protein